MTKPRKRAKPLTEDDAAAYPIDDATRAAILEGLAQADRQDYVPDEIVAAGTSVTEFKIGARTVSGHDQMG